MEAAKKAGWAIVEWLHVQQLSEDRGKVLGCQVIFVKMEILCSFSLLLHKNTIRLGNLASYLPSVVGMDTTPMLATCLTRTTCN
jgi:hypothetical protein